MTTEMIPGYQTETRALAERREELLTLEAGLAAGEPELAKLQSELLQFERVYLSVVGTRYDDLAAIEKEIARLQGLEFKDDAGEAGSAESMADDIVGCGQNRLHSDRLRKLYHEVARKFHPDLVQCEIERNHRHQLMVEANHAYQAGEEDRLTELLVAGETLETISDRGMSAEMIVLLRRISEAKSALAAIGEEQERIQTSEIFKLMRRVQAAGTLGENILDDLVSQVDRQIRKARNRLEHLRELVIITS
ncbi:MAG: hypothetical protein EBZ36_06110 [Acidobacteria bacterium]|nr:hypothetical protein [Acidobacteriota bacterium]